MDEENGRRPGVADPRIQQSPGATIGIVGRGRRLIGLEGNLRIEPRPQNVSAPYRDGGGQQEDQGEAGVADPLAEGQPGLHQR